MLRLSRKTYLEKGLFDIETFHPDIETETFSIQLDHLHLVIVIPPKYSVFAIKPWQRTTFVKAWVNAILARSLRACSPQSVFCISFVGIPL